MKTNTSEILPKVIKYSKQTITVHITHILAMQFERHDDSKIPDLKALLSK